MNKRTAIAIISLMVVSVFIVTAWGKLFSATTGLDTDRLLPEIQREQAIREVEVSLWETANAIFYYMNYPSAVSLEEYRKQLLDVENFMGVYSNLVTEGPELKMIAEFNRHWETSVSHAEGLLPLRDQLQALKTTLSNDMNHLEQVIGNESLLVLSGSPAQIQDKKLLLQGLIANLWHITTNLSLAMHSTIDEHNRHFKAQQQSVTTTWERYLNLDMSNQEQEFITSLKQQIEKYLNHIQEGYSLSRNLKQQSLSFWESMHEVDDVIDFEMQEEFKSRLNTCLGVESF